MKLPERVLELQREFDFIVEQNPEHSDILHIIFNDGRQYKLQKPGFFTIHEIMTDYGNEQHKLFLYGIEHLYPENKETQKIDEKYLNKNQREAFALWSVLIRELLLSG